MPNWGVVRRTGRAVAEAAGGLVLSRGRRGALAFPPASPGSEGDDLLVHGINRLLDQPVKVAVASPSERWGSVGVDPRARDFLNDFLEVVRRYARDDHSWLAAAATRSWDRAWFIGADVLDGAYGTTHLRPLDWLDLFDQGGRPVGVCGFSFREFPDPRAVVRLQATRAGVVFVARGPVSAARFGRSVGRPCHVGPDLSWAVLTEEYERAAPEPRTAHSPTIGCNLGPQVAGLVGVDRLTDLMARVLGDHARAGATVELVPHDHRGSPSDLDLLTGLAERLGLGPSAMTFVRGPVLRARVGTCDLILSCRMHLTISALAFGVPVVALGYNSKFEDLAADPMLAPYLRVLDPVADDLEDRIRAASDELLGQGRMTTEALRALHAGKRAQLASLATTLATGVPPLGGC